MSVLILSTDKILADAIGYELKLAGIQVSPAVAPGEEEEQLAICDLDSMPAPQNSVTITHDRAKTADFHRPFLMSELIDEVKRRLAERAAAAKAGDKAYKIKVDSLRITENCAWLGEKQIPLTATEAALLSLLASRPDTPFSREEIGRAVWGEDSLDTNRCEVYIRYLREKLELPDAPRRIITLRGKGYMLKSFT